MLKETTDNNEKNEIEFDAVTKIVSYNPFQEESVEALIDNIIDVGLSQDVKVWPVFRVRQGLHSDAAPLVYAFDGENGWRFCSEKVKNAIEKKIEMIVSKYVSKYPMDVTILLPDSDGFNSRIAEVIMSKSKNAELIKGVICNLTTEEVYDIVLEFNSKFREYYKKDFNSATYRLGKYLEQMDEERKCKFIRNLVEDTEMRKVLDVTLKVSKDRYAEFANKINGQNMLLIDDTLSRGQSIKEVVRIMSESYAPRSITVLTLFSK